MFRWAQTPCREVVRVEITEQDEVVEVHTIPLLAWHALCRVAEADEFPPETFLMLAIAACMREKNMTIEQSLAWLMPVAGFGPNGGDEV